MKRYYYYAATMQNGNLIDIDESSLVIGDNQNFIDYLSEQLEICKDYVDDIIYKNDNHILVNYKDNITVEYLIYKVQDINF